MNKHKISVAICTYNGEKYIKEQLDSILNQTVSVHEIILCDDGSSDQTLQIAEDVLSASGILYQIFENKPGLGVAANFLKCMKLTTGDYVFTCDQDDIWHVDKVEIFMSAAKKNSAALFFSNGDLVDGEGISLQHTLWESYFIDYNTMTSNSIFSILLQRPLVTGAAMMVSRDLIQSVDHIPHGFLHDEWFSIAAAVKDSIFPIDDSTFDYRQHGNNVVGAKKEGFFLRLIKWMSGFKKLAQHHLLRKQKADEIVSFVVGSPYTNDAKLAQEFWTALSTLKSVNLFLRFKVVFNLYRSGCYHKFYTGKRGALRDFLSCIFL